MTPNGKKGAGLTVPDKTRPFGRSVPLSPDGKRAAFVVIEKDAPLLNAADDAHPLKVVVQALDKSGEEKVIDLPAAGLHLCWTADGKKLVVAKTTEIPPNAKFESVLLDPETGKTERLDLPAGVRVLECARYGETNPFLFFCSFGDRGLIDSVRRGRRRDYALQGEVPDPQATVSFTASRLSWSWPDGSPRAGLRRLYRDLLAARRRWPALKDVVNRRARLLPDPVDGPVLELVRGGALETLHAYFNLSAVPQPLPAEVPEGVRVLYSSEWHTYGGGRAEGDGGRELYPFECLAFGREPVRL